MSSTAENPCERRIAATLAGSKRLTERSSSFLSRSVRSSQSSPPAPAWHVRSGTRAGPARSRSSSRSRRRRPRSCACSTRFSSRRNAITSSCSHWIQPLRDATNHRNADTAGFYVSHARSSFGTVRAYATWGYTRIQGALKNLGHHVGRSTIARILRKQGIPPSGQRPMVADVCAGALTCVARLRPLHEHSGDAPRIGHPRHGVHRRAVHVSYVRSPHRRCRSMAFCDRPSAG
jgi:HTH-like domain